MNEGVIKGGTDVTDTKEICFVCKVRTKVLVLRGGDFGTFFAFGGLLSLGELCVFYFGFLFDFIALD